MSRSIADPGFPGDDGAPDPAVTAALAAYASGEGEYVDALAALRESRLLVPVVAIAGEVEVDADGLARDKTSEMAMVLLTRPDGRRGMLAFTGTASLAAWNAEARPVPVSTLTAAQSAVHEQAEALVVDVAGPVRFPIEGEDLRALAAGWRLARVGERSTDYWAWIRPATE